MAIRMSGYSYEFEISPIFIDAGDFYGKDDLIIWVQ
jgi:hypothetical protein